jgi:hypothetical protein
MLLRMGAEDSLLRFIEVISPDTVPARHHRLLITHLEAVERGDIGAAPSARDYGAS